MGMQGAAAQVVWGSEGRYVPTKAPGKRLGCQCLVMIVAQGLSLNPGPGGKWSSCVPSPYFSNCLAED